MTKVRRYYTDETETHNARNIEQLAQGEPALEKQGGFCTACKRWSVKVSADKCLCKNCDKRSKELG